jgi:endo-1,4-beta-xylanase
VLGEKYLDVAFNAAHASAPNAKLFLNDYSTADPNRLACLVKVVGDLVNRGVPISGVGHEMHNAINYPSVPAMVNAINTIADNFPGMDQQITELDMSVYNAGDSKSNYGNNIPPSVLVEQGWLYKAYFDAFRQLKGELSRVTIWGMSDDETWLDSFPVNRTDYPLPFDMKLQAKPAYWGIVDPSHLPGYGMALTSSVTAGISDTRTITLTATNGNVGTAYATQIAGLNLTQQSKPSCSPKIISPSSFPIVLGDIPASGTATTSVTLSIVGCNPNAQWQVSVPWNANTYETGTYTFTTNFNRGVGSN